MKLALVPAIINLLFRAENGVDFHSPACSCLQIDHGMVTALSRFVVGEPTTDVGHLNSLCSVGVVIGV